MLHQLPSADSLNAFNQIDRPLLGDQHKPHKPAIVVRCTTHVYPFLKGCVCMIFELLTMLHKDYSGTLVAATQEGKPFSWCCEGPTVRSLINCPLSDGHTQARGTFEEDIFPTSVSTSTRISSIEILWLCSPLPCPMQQYGCILQQPWLFGTPYCVEIKFVVVCNQNTSNPQVGLFA